MTKTKWAVTAATLGALLLAGNAIAADKKVVAVSIPAADHGWTSGIVYHAQAAAKEINAAFPNVEVVVKTSPSAAAQVSALEDLSAGRKLDALVILPHTSEELTMPVKAVKEGGTFITVVDRGLNDPAIQDLYLAGDNIAVGKNTAKFLVDKLGGKGNLVVLRGIPTVIDDERIQGFKDGIAGSDLKILDIQYANWNSDDAFKLMQDYLAKYPQIDAVWANDDDML
ncbi:MAG TPA: substrate-binding domain-containing protein, partial [Kaistia sp.]|nr:substrate-binding domain-containing protein [Kaistia sp.]